MTSEQIMESVVAATRGNDAAIQRVSAALLTRDKAQIRRTFKEVAGLDLTEEQLETAVKDYSAPDKIAAWT
jgi:hypothetical protein